MLGDFITRIIILLVGYAYPAYKCYKSVEKKKLEIQELRYWCKYWILVSLLTVFERIGDIIVSWLPLYGEIKIGLLIYLWYPKSQGITYVYETLLLPYMSSYHWILQIFKHPQQRFAIDKKSNQSKSKDKQQQTRTSFMFLR
ncbi:hypothetical protein AALP_AA8G057700 [Arabis alpina]|uniref:HVA22-like protein n=1 Tax=Arabis alpina TaxID=50452 RepID=A0A087G575_ARAAL|nr:hypothetical protein AALP_AA8G057700 [Arabis alpina]